MVDEFGCVATKPNKSAFVLDLHKFLVTLLPTEITPEKPNQ